MQAAARYHRISIALHWIMALCLFAMIGSGLSMEYFEMPKPDLFRLIQWHKSLGVIVLWLIGVRIFWRLTHRAPALPDAISKRDAVLSKLGHLGLYAWMLALPLSGWLMVSASPYGLPTIVFGWFEWPHVPGITMDKTVSGLAHEAHTLLAYSLIALVTVHIAAVLKHRIAEGINLLPRMGIGRNAS